MVKLKTQNFIVLILLILRMMKYLQMTTLLLSVHQVLPQTLPVIPQVATGCTSNDSPEQSKCKVPPFLQ